MKVFAFSTLLYLTHYCIMNSNAGYVNLWVKLMCKII